MSVAGLCMTRFPATPRLEILCDIACQGDMHHTAAVPVRCMSITRPYCISKGRFMALVWRVLPTRDSGGTDDHSIKDIQPSGSSQFGTSKWTSWSTYKSFLTPRRSFPRFWFRNYFTFRIRNQSKGYGNWVFMTRKHVLAMITRLSWILIRSFLEYSSQAGYNWFFPLGFFVDQRDIWGKKRRVFWNIGPTYSLCWSSTSGLSFRHYLHFLQNLLRNISHPELRSLAFQTKCKNFLARFLSEHLLG